MVHASIGVDDCGKAEDELQMANKGIPVPKASLDAFQYACSWHTKIFRGYAIAGVGAAAAVLSLIVLTRDPVSPDGHVAAARSRSGLAIAPLIGPDLAGAQIALAW
jgi:hypothetical protein